MRYWRIVTTAVVFAYVRNYLGYTPDTTLFYFFLDCGWIISIYLLTGEIEKLKEYTKGGQLAALCGPPYHSLKVLLSNAVTSISDLIIEPIREIVKSV